MIFNPSKWSSWLLLSLFAFVPLTFSSLRNRTDDSEAPHMSKRAESAAMPDEAAVSTPAEDPALSRDEISMDEFTPAKPKPSAAPKRIDRADAFVAGPDWEFDGFVAGGQDSNVRSMFYLNDLIYLNIGAQQGVNIGDKIGIYKRGDKVRDPQTGKFIGYEVRRAAFAKATDKVDEETCAVRILSTFEAVEIGDLVRRE